MPSFYPTDRMERNQALLQRAVELCGRKETTLRRELEYLAGKWAHYIARLAPQKTRHPILDELFNQTLDLTRESITVLAKAQRLFGVLAEERILSPGDWRGEEEEVPVQQLACEPTNLPTIH